MTEGVGVGALEVPPLGLLLDGQSPFPVERDHCVPVGVDIPLADGDAEHHQAADLVALVGREGPERGGAAEVDVDRLDRVVDVPQAGVRRLEEPLALGDPRGVDEVDLAEDLVGSVDAGASGRDHPALLEPVDHEGCVGAGYAEEFGYAVLGYLAGCAELYGVRYVAVAVEVQQRALGESELVHERGVSL